MTRVISGSGPTSFTGLAAYAEARRHVNEAMDAARVIVRDAFDEGAYALLADLKAESFGWTQYTPYFNDGDACIFSVHSSYPEINGKDEWGDNGTSGTDDGFTKEDYDKVTKFLELFGEDDMDFMFGDHVKVTVKLDGTSVEEYSHD